MGNTQNSSIERKIYYYDLSVYTRDSNKKIQRNVGTHLKRILEKIYIQNQEIMECEEPEKQKEKIDKISVKTDNDDILYIIVDEFEEQKPVKTRIVLCRQDAFPFIEKNGQLSNMTSEVTGEFAVAEVTHCVIYPEEFFMGAEYNFNGARPSSIARYLKMMSDDIVDMKCEGRLRNDVFNKILVGKGYSLFDISFRNTPEMLIEIRNHMPFIQAFTQNIADVDSYEVIIRRRLSKKKKGFDLQLSQKEIEEFVTTNREDIKRFKVCQGAYADSVDLLKDKLVHTQEFVLTKNKVIESTEMYDAIISFYNEQFRAN